jgi:hypothetical protein
MVKMSSGIIGVTVSVVVGIVCFDVVTLSAFPVAP